MLSSGVGDTLTLLCSSTSNFKREISLIKIRGCNCAFVFRGIPAHV